MLDMYKGVVNSPETTTTNTINNTDTIIYVLDETRVPSDLPNLITLGSGTSAETVKVLSVEGKAVTVERGFQGVAKNWNAGTILSRNFTEYDYNSLLENINELDTEKLNKSEKTTINEKTGAIKKEDIVALGIPSQDTTYTEISTTEIDTGTSSALRTITGRRVKYMLDKVQGWISAITKADVGLGNVDNVKQATKTEFESHKLEKATQSGYGHIRLQDIPNPIIATRVEAEAGTDNTKMMTPLRAKESVESNPLVANGKGSISSQGSTGSVTNEHLKQVNVSKESTVSGDVSQVNASDISNVKHPYCQVNASRGVVSSGDFVSIWGFGLSPSTQNRKVEINSYDGTIKASGAITGNSSFADFAEYFESTDGKAIPLGTIVSLGEGGKIKIATEGEYMVGVISQTAGIILNAQGFEWKDRYLYDRYGQPILVDKEVVNEKTGEVEIIKTQMLNINYKEDEEYIGREDREEWNVVGLTGQIFVNVDNIVKEGDFIQAGVNGIATKGRNEYGQNWQVMKITTPYEEDLGFGIALVFIR